MGMHLFFFFYFYKPFLIHGMIKQYIVTDTDSHMIYLNNPQLIFIINIQELNSYILENDSIPKMLKRLAKTFTNTFTNISLLTFKISSAPKTGKFSYKALNF